MLILLEVNILLSSPGKDSLVQVSLAYDKEDVLLNLSTFCQQDIKGQEEELFLPYYGELGKKTHLCIGSGLEGLLAKKILQMLKVDYQVEYEDQSERLYFRLRLPKKGKEV